MEIPGVFRGGSRRFGRSRVWSWGHESTGNVAVLRAFEAQEHDQERQQNIAQLVYLVAGGMMPLLRAGSNRVTVAR